MNDLFMKREAVISTCGKYRYLLRREWNPERPRALFIMLNPSTADAEIDDPTIRSCVRLAKSWGYGSFEVVNIFAWRATDPNELAKADDPIGKQNEAVITSAIRRSDIVVCAWGAHYMANGPHKAVIGLIGARKPAAYCLGKTKHGAPKHPLYIKTGTMPVVY